MERTEANPSIIICCFIYWYIILGSRVISVISLVGTKLDGNSTRNNLFAIAGISLSLVAGITIIITLMT